MLKIVKKQYNCRSRVKKSEIKVKVLKTVSSITIDKDLINLTRNWLTHIATYWKIGRIRNICFLTGRTRATTQKWQLSRMMIREFGNGGFFGGFRKTSW